MDSNRALTEFNLAILTGDVANCKKLLADGATVKSFITSCTKRVEHPEIQNLLDFTVLFDAKDIGRSILYRLLSSTGEELIKPENLELFAKLSVTAMIKLAESRKPGKRGPL